MATYVGPQEVADKIIAWQERTGLRMALYTWLTINVGKHPRLLQKLRQANFDMLFIGVESFSSHALLETAKVQNTTGDMIATLREIQSYGFVIVAGLIFGFDSDTEESFTLTLDGMLESGLISGDPSLLTALPGTPLYRRMQLSGRLRNNKHSLGGYKYCTNIRYLMPREQLVSGYQAFVKRFCQGDYQYQTLAELPRQPGSRQVYTAHDARLWEPRHVYLHGVQKPACYQDAGPAAVENCRTPRCAVGCIAGHLVAAVAVSTA